MGCISKLGFYPVNYTLPTARTPSPYPNNLSGTGDPLGKRGFWVGVKLVKCRKKSKKPQPNLSLNNTVRKLAS